MKETPFCFTNLIVFYGINEVSPLIKLAVQHYQFESIHYIIKHKTDYYRLLQEVRTTNKWEEWVLFMLKGVEETAKGTIKQILVIKALFSKTQETIKTSAAKLYDKELLELIFEQPYCKIEFVVDRMDVSRITASKYLKGLEQIGVLTSKKVWKETLYVNGAIVPIWKPLCQILGIRVKGILFESGYKERNLKFIR